MPLVDLARTGGERRLDIGDILPNLQEAWRPVFRPREVQAERGGQVSGEELRQTTRSIGEALRGDQGTNIQRIGEAAQRTGQAIQQAGRSGKTPVGQALLGLPEAIINTFSVPGQAAEQAIGYGAQAIGLPVEAQGLARSATGPAGVPGLVGQVIGQSTAALLEPLVRREGVKLMRRLSESTGIEWFDRQADRLSSSYAPETGTEQILATAVAWARRAGVPDEPFVRMLGVLAGDQAPELIANAETMVQRAGITGGMSTPSSRRAAWDAAAYTWENTSRLLGARQRLEAGEDAQSVLQDIEGQLTTTERIRDLVGQVLVDPLNIVGGVAGSAQDARRIGRIAQYSLAASDEVPDLTRFGRTFGVWGKLEDLPVIGPIIRRTPITRANLLRDDVLRTVTDLTESIHPDAAARLAARGVTADPRLVMLDLLMNPTTDDVAGLGITSDTAREILGLTARQATAVDAARFGIPVGARIDRLTSQAANTARQVLAEMGGKRAAGMLDSWETAFQQYQDAFRLTGRARTKALDEADQALTNVLDRIGAPVREMLGYTRPTGVGAGAKQLFDDIQGLHATYLHMGLSPGWAIRNLLNNTSKLLTEGIDTFSPISRIDDQYLRLGLVPAHREFGGAADALTRRRNLLQRVADWGPQRWSREFENRAGRRAFLTGFARTMNREMRVGRAIDVQWVRQLADALGIQRADEVATAFTHARTQQDVGRIIERLTGDQPWKALADEDIIRSLDAINESAVSEVTELLDSSEDFADFERKLNDWQRAYQQQTREVYEMAPLSNDDPMREWYDDLQTYVQQVTEESEQRLVHTEFQTRLNAWRVERDVVRSTFDAMAEDIEAARLAGRVDPNVAAQLHNEARQVQTQIINRIESTRATRDRWRNLIRSGNWQGQDIYENAESISQAWNIYFDKSTELWETAFIDELRSLHQFLTNAEAATGIQRPLPDLVEVMQRLPIPAPRQRQLLAVLVQEAEVRGIARPHLANILHKEGLIPGRFLDPVDVTSRDWFNRAVDAIRQRGDVLPDQTERYRDLTAKLNDMFGRAEDMARELTPANAPSMYRYEQMAMSQMVEADNAIPRVLDYVRGRLSLGAVSQDEVKAIRTFGDQVSSRLGDLRTVSRKMGEIIRDATLFNYRDRRNFDVALGFLFSYPFWYSRNLASWAASAFTNPQGLATLVKMRLALRRANRDLPDWWKDQLTLATPFGNWYLPILNSIDPLNSFFGDKFEDPDVEDGNPVRALLHELAQWGPGLHSVVNYSLAAWAALEGRPEEANTYVSYLGQPTRAFNAATALLGVGPAGGIGLEPWQWRTTENGLRYVGSKWESRRVAKVLVDMLNAGDISWEQARDAIYYQSGDVYDTALQRMREEQGVFVLLSWMFGTAFRARPEVEIDIARMDNLAHAIMTQKPTEYGGTSDEAMTPEEYRLAWRQLEEAFTDDTGRSWVPLVYLSRRTGDERDERYVWTVMNSLPPNSRVYLEAVGLEPELVDQWYASQFNNMSPLAKERFLNGMMQMGAMLQLPEGATRQEWLAVKDQYFTMRERLGREFGQEIFELEQAYYTVRDTQGQTQAQTFLEDNPALEMMWRRKDDLLSQNTLMMRYYGSMDLLERVSRAQFEDQMREQYPDLDVDAFWQEYFRLREIDSEAAAAWWEEHPEMSEYMDARDAWTLDLRETLTEMADVISAAQGKWATLRSVGERPLSSEETPGQRTIRELIQSGSRPMGDFELPADLSAREVQSALNLELSAIPDDAWRGVYRALKDMGDLDDILTSYQEWGKGAGSVQTVQTNLTELQALLAALSAIRETNGWQLTEAGAAPDIRRARGTQTQADGVTVTRTTAGTTGTTTTTGTGTAQAAASSTTTSAGSGERQVSAPRERTVRSSRSSTASSQTANEIPAWLPDWLTQLRENTPLFYGWLVNYIDMDEASRKAFLSNKPHFARALLKWRTGGLDLAVVARYLLSPRTATRGGRQSEGGRAVSRRFSLYRG
jgi:hypothetical protein